jgi:hypothetical protein
MKIKRNSSLFFYEKARKIWALISHSLLKKQKKNLKFESNMIIIYYKVFKKKLCPLCHAQSVLIFFVGFVDILAT